MSRRLRRLSKVAVAMGGFLIFVGAVMIGVFALTLFGVVDASVVEKALGIGEYRIMFLGALLVIGALDIVSGIILSRR